MAQVDSPTTQGTKPPTIEAAEPPNPDAGLGNIVDLTSQPEAIPPDEPEGNPNAAKDRILHHCSGVPRTPPVWNPPGNDPSYTGLPTRLPTTDDEMLVGKTHQLVKEALAADPGIDLLTLGYFEYDEIIEGNPGAAAVYTKERHAGIADRFEELLPTLLPKVLLTRIGIGIKRVLHRSDWEVQRVQTAWATETASTLQQRLQLLDAVGLFPRAQRGEVIAAVCLDWGIIKVPKSKGRSPQRERRMALCAANKMQHGYRWFTATWLRKDFEVRMRATGFKWSALVIPLDGTGGGYVRLPVYEDEEVGKAPSESVVTDVHGLAYALDPELFYSLSMVFGKLHLYEREDIPVEKVLKDAQAQQDRKDRVAQRTAAGTLRLQLEVARAAKAREPKPNKKLKLVGLAALAEIRDRFPQR